MGQPVTISTASVPPDYCPASFAEAWVFGAGLLNAELSGSNFTFNFGDTIPLPADQDKPWIPQSFSGTNPPAFVYTYVNGAWIMPHPMAPGIIVLYLGAEASIDTFDGGEVGIVTDTTGPMWEKVADFNARFPIGAGTLPSTTVVAVTGTGGEEKHTLLLTEMPNHDHGLPSSVVSETASGAKNIDLDFGGTDAKGDAVASEGGDPTASNATVPHNNLPPFVGVFFIRRTARKFYRR